MEQAEHLRRNYLQASHQDEEAWAERVGCGKTELRTKEEQAVVPAKFKEAKERPRERNGTVLPKEAESQPGAPATFTYEAPATRVKHSGFWVGAVSRAGVAQARDGEWEVADASLCVGVQIEDCLD